jgi:YidC/Oxa1 family membrane protein insertase
MGQTQLQRTILWVVFGVSMFMLWEKWQAHNGQPSMFLPHPTPSATAPAPVAGQKAQPDATVPSVTGTTTAAPSAEAAQNAAVVQGKLITLANEVVSLQVDTQGAQIRRAELLTQKDTEDPSRNVALLEFDSPKAVYMAQSGWVGAPQGQSFPTHQTAFEVTEGPTKGPDGVSLVLSSKTDALKVVRTLLLRPGAYTLEQTDTVTNTGSQPIQPTQYLQLVRDSHKPPGESRFYSTYTGPAIYTEKGKFQKVDFSAIDSGKASEKFEKAADNGWIGLIQHYFVAAWLPPEKIARDFYGDRIDPAPFPVQGNFYRVGAKFTLPELAPAASATISARLLVAPQDQRMLEQLAPGLDLVVDYGWLTVIAKPIYWLMSFLHRIVGNWGWAIVLLTLIIKTIFFPLQAASYKSMARMKAVTPRLTALRERYGNDRVKMNEAMMQLYREEKINPLGGCLPIVVQIPVFIALYWVLLANVEMRAAPWLGWIHDLAAPDPYFVLPLVMAATMFIQTKLNPTPPDPVQAKMMMIMPLVFSVMFFFFPSGLVLYWLVNNLYSIIQQWVITRRIASGPADGRAKAKG